MTKSNSVSVYRRFCSPIRGKIVEEWKEGRITVYVVRVTSRRNEVYEEGEIVDVLAGDIYDSHRVLAKGRVAFTGKAWKEGK